MSASLRERRSSLPRAPDLRDEQVACAIVAKVSESVAGVVGRHLVANDWEGLRLEIRVNRHLIEVLIAGVIIAGVFVVLVTVDARAAGKARELRCASNMHQLAVALQQYADDYEKLPHGPNWQAPVLTYARTEDQSGEALLTCPSRPDDPGFATGLNCDVAGRRCDGVFRQVWLIEVRDGTPEYWWANDIRYHRLRHNRHPVSPHRGRCTMVRGDGSVRARDPLRLTEKDWIPPPEQ